MTFLLRAESPAALWRSAPDYRALFESAPEPMLIVDPAGGIVLDANSAAAAMLGRARADLLAVPLPPPLDSERALQGVLRGEAPTCEFPMGDRVVEAAAAWPELGGA